MLSCRVSSPKRLIIALGALAFDALALGALALGALALDALAMGALAYVLKRNVTNVIKQLGQ